MNIKSFFAALLALVALSACTTEPAVDELSGTYPAPEELTLDLLSQERVKGEKTTTFNLILATEGVTLNGEEFAGGGEVLYLQFIGNNFFLAQNTYTAKTADEAKNGNYIVGEGGSVYYSVENGVATAKLIESGSINVHKEENDYEIYGTIWLADQSIVKFEAAVNIAYEPFPEPIKLTQALSATSNLANGINTVTLQLASPDIYSEVDMTTYQTIWHGEGFYLSTDIYSPDGYLHEGTYRANAVGGTVGEGEFGIGYDTEMDFGWGPMLMENWGTCWWTVAEGTATAQKILEGEITVAKKGSKYTITYKGGDLWCEFNGAIDALNPDAGAGGGEDTTDYEELSVLLSAQSNVGYGTPSLTINMATEGVGSSFDTTTYQTVYTGTGNYLAMDIYSADGKLHTGTYKANAVGGTVGEGEFGIGYDTEMDFGWGPMLMENWGTCWWTVTDGATSAEKVLDGTVVVAVEGENLVIKLQSSITNAKFTYPVADFKDGQGNAIEVVNNAAPTIEYEELSVLLSAQSNVGYGTPSLTINMATEGVGSSFDTTTYQTVYTGTGNYLAMDIYSADGTLAEGTYTANTVGGTIAEGEFGIGYDTEMDFGWGPMLMENWGTCWWTVTDGATSAEKVLDGTVTVTKDGDNYTITLESSLVNAQYVGAIAIP